MDYITILGFAAGICTTAAFVPQVIKAWKTKSTHDLSLAMLVTFSIGITAWLVYGIFINSLPVIIANLVTIFLALILLSLKIKYR